MLYNKPMIGFYGGVGDVLKDYELRIVTRGHRFFVTELGNEELQISLNSSRTVPILGKQIGDDQTHWKLYYTSDDYFILHYGAYNINIPPKKALALKNNKLIYVDTDLNDHYQHWKLIPVNNENQVKILNRGTGRFISIFHITPYNFPILDPNDAEYATVFTDKYALLG